MIRTEASSKFPSIESKFLMRLYQLFIDLLEIRLLKIPINVRQ